MRLPILLVIMAMAACESKTMFTPLPKHTETGIYDRDDERKGKKYVYQSVLVNNPPRDKKSMKKLLASYHSKNMDSVFSDIEVITLSSFFYYKNGRTSYFINSSDDPGGFSSEILIDYYKQYGIAEMQTKRIGNTAALKTEITFAHTP